jgi:hypothetical protein
MDAKPQPVAVHLHNTDSHKLPMSDTSTSSRDRTALAFAVNRDRLQVYGESAFRYFMDIERERSVRSERPCVLVRVDLKDSNGASAAIPETTSERLFLALNQSVRETDFLGWYEEKRVAGAVLTEIAEEQQAEGVRRAVERIRRTFEDTFPVEVSSRLDIRVTTVRDERAWSRL